MIVDLSQNDILSSRNDKFQIIKKRFYALKDRKMADSVQVHLPTEITPILDDPRAARAAKCEPTTNKAIVIDALKGMHSRLKEQQ